MEELGINVEYLSPASCAIQSVEKVWAILKRRVFHRIHLMPVTEVKKMKLSDYRVIIEEPTAAFEPEMAARV